MKLKVIIGQRLESYAGQYGLEALACMTEHDEEENSDYLPQQLIEARHTKEFESVAIVTLEVREGEIRKILQPSETVVQAKVI